MPKITITEHYPISDPECNGDYYDVTVAVNNKVVAAYGDHYHDEGVTRARGFVDGYMSAVPQITFTVNTKMVADREEL